MEESSEASFDRIAWEMWGETLMHFTITEKDGTVLKIYVVAHTVRQKVAVLFSDDFLIVNFDTPFGKDHWVKSLWMLHGSKFLLIEDGMSESLGIYHLDGTRASVSLNSPYNTIEVFYRIRKEARRSLVGQPFLQVPDFQSLAEMSALGRA